VSARGLQRRVWKVLGLQDDSITLLEDTLERVEGATLAILAIVTELKATVARLETAVVEQGRTMHDTLNRVHEEAVIRGGVGQEQMRQSSVLDALDRKLADHGRRLAAVERRRGAE
jgi:hypothetical protein